MSASLALQKLLVTALADVPGITGVYDGPPAEAVSPYLVVGSDLVIDWGTKTDIGHEHRIAVNVWHEGPGASVAKQLLGRVENRLRNLSGSRDGHRVALVRLQRSLVLTAAEGWSQGIIEMRVTTTEI